MNVRECAIGGCGRRVFDLPTADGREVVNLHPARVAIPDGDTRWRFITGYVAHEETCRGRRATTPHGGGQR